MKCSADIRTDEPDDLSGIQRSMWSEVTTGIIYSHAWVKRCEYQDDCKVEVDKSDPAVCPACGSLVVRAPRRIQTNPSSVMTYAFRYVYAADSDLYSCRCGAQMLICCNGCVSGCAYPAYKEDEDTI